MYMSIFLMRKLHLYVQKKKKKICGKNDLDKIWNSERA